LSATSKYSHLVVEERDHEATLTLFARNPLVSWIVLTVGVLRLISLIASGLEEVVALLVN